jgi:ABC-type transporter Mla MlaB component
MFHHTIIEEWSSGTSLQKTLYLAGTIAAGQKLDLQTLMLETLLSCDHLVVNCDKVTAFDNDFIVLLCSVHQTTQRLNKRLTITEDGPLSFSRACNKTICPKSGRCLIENCLLEHHRPDNPAIH